MHRGNQAIGKKHFFGTVMLKTMQLTPLEYTHIVIYLLAVRKFQSYLYGNSQIQSSISSDCTFAKMQYLRDSLSKIAPAGRQFEVCPLPWKKTLVTGTCYILTTRPSRTFNLTLKTTLVKMKLWVLIGWSVHCLNFQTYDVWQIMNYVSHYQAAWYIMNTAISLDQSNLAISRGHLLSN